MSDCGIVILAAGAASRMGKPKQLGKLCGVSLLRRCARTALATSRRPIHVVLGANAGALKPEIADLEVTPLINPDWVRGIGTSIRVGVAAAAQCDAVVLLLCDQPLVTAGDIEQLVSERAKSGKPIAAAAYAGTLGTPAVFAAGLFGELLALSDEQGGKFVIQRHAAQVQPISIPQAAVDIDTEADFQRLLTSFPDSIR